MRGWGTEVPRANSWCRAGGWAVLSWRDRARPAATPCPRPPQSSGQTPPCGCPSSPSAPASPEAQPGAEGGLPGSSPGSQPSLSTHPGPAAASSSARPLRTRRPGPPAPQAPSCAAPCTPRPPVPTLQVSPERTPGSLPGAHQAALFGCPGRILTPSSWGSRPRGCPWQAGGALSVFGVSGHPTCLSGSQAGLQRMPAASPGEAAGSLGVRTEARGGGGRVLDPWCCSWPDP